MRLLGINKLNQTSLLDNTPLMEFLDKILPCELIQESIDAGFLHALSITASGYGTGQSVTFYQGVKELTPCGAPDVWVCQPRSDKTPAGFGLASIPVSPDLDQP